MLEQCTAKYVGDEKLDQIAIQSAQQMVLFSLFFSGKKLTRACKSFD
jgi:hypothetical protein